MSVTIPLDVVASARNGAYELAREAAEAIVELLDGGRARRDREAYHRALARLTRAYALLDVIGWQVPEDGRREVVVGAEYAITLYEALQEGLVGEEHGVEAKRESTQMAERTVEAVRGFMDAMGGVSA